MKLRLFQTCMIVLGAFPSAFSSGYHPPLDHELNQAELIVQGDIVESWNPFENDKSGNIFRERAYRMVVEKCFKGALSLGAEVFFWDPHCHVTMNSPYSLKILRDPLGPL